MKKFDGLHPEAYDTIFGIVNLEIDKSDDDGMLVIKQVSDTPIKFPCIVDHERVVGMRRFYTIESALEHIDKMENDTYNRINKIYSDVFL